MSGSICKIMLHNINLIFLHVTIMGQSSKLLASKTHILTIFHDHSPSLVI